MTYTNSGLWRFLLILAIVGIKGEESSRFSDVDGSVNDDIVTISNCYPRDSESHSSSSDSDDATEQCMSAYINRQSANISLNDNRKGDPNGFLMSIEVKSLREISPCGENIISAGHSYNGFSDQKFLFSEVQDGLYNNVSVKYVSLDTTLTNSANLNIRVYLMNGYGTINNGNEAIAVTPGGAKINVQITNWPFCGQGDVICGQCPYYEIGQYLDLEIAVKGTSAAVQEETGENNGLLYRVGRGTIVFSQKVQIDGSDDVSSISTGNQVHKRQNYKDIFQLRFPKFDSEILYDPYISAGGAYGKK